MKKFIIILIALVITGSLAKAQFSHLKEIKLQSSEDYSEFAEQVLDCSYYLLMTPYSKRDADRVAATNFITRWLKGSPTAGFTVSETIKTVTEEKEALIGLYISCYAKQLLEDDENVLSSSELEEKALHSLVNYCNNPNNKIKPTKELKKLNS